MQTKILKIFILIIFIKLIFPESTYPRGLKFGIDYGLSRFDGFWKEYWEEGYSVGTHIYYSYNSKIMIGANIRYSGWRPSKDLTFMHSEPSWEESGFGKIIEIVPSLRFTAYRYRRYQVFCQLGLGLYYVNFDAKFISPYDKSYWINRDRIVEYKKSRLGFNVGAGVSVELTKYLNLYLIPSYQFVETQIENIVYYSVNIGIINNF